MAWPVQVCAWAISVPHYKRMINGGEIFLSDIIGHERWGIWGPTQCSMNFGQRRAVDKVPLK